MGKKNFIKENILAISGVLLFFALLLYPLSLSFEGKAALAILILAFFLWLSEALPIGVSSWIVAILIIILGVEKDANKVWKNFGHSSVFFLLGSFILAQGLIKYNVHKIVAEKIIRITGNSVEKLVFALVLTTSLLSAFISDHIVAAMMLPLIIAIAESQGGAIEHPKFAKLLALSIAFGVACSGFATPSGAARNVIAMDYLREIFGRQISYLEWSIIAFPVAFSISLITAIILPKMIKPEIENLNMEKVKDEISVNNVNSRTKSVIAIFSLTIFLFIFLGTKYELGTIAMLGASLMFIIGAIDWNDMRKVSWNTIFLYGAALALGNAIKDTEAGKWIVKKLLSFLTIKSNFSLVAFTSLVSFINTQFMASSPNVAVIGPVILEIAKELNLNPVLHALAVVIPGSFAYTTLFGTPSNAIVYASGYLRARDFVKYGAIQAALSMLVYILFGLTYWRWLGII